MAITEETLTEFEANIKFLNDYLRTPDDMILNPASGEMVRSFGAQRAYGMTWTEVHSSDLIYGFTTAYANTGWTIPQTNGVSPGGVYGFTGEIRASGSPSQNNNQNPLVGNPTGEELVNLPVAVAGQLRDETDPNEIVLFGLNGEPLNPNILSADLIFFALARDANYNLIVASSARSVDASPFVIRRLEAVLPLLP